MKEVIKFIFSCMVNLTIICSCFTILVFGSYLLPRVINFTNAGMFIQIIMSIGVFGLVVFPMYFWLKYMELI